LLSACEWIFERRPLDEIAAGLVAWGYEALELVGEPERKDLSLLETIVQGAGLRISGTTANTASIIGRDLAHPERDLRKQAVNYYRGCIGLATRFGAPSIGLHPSAEGRLEPVSTYEREWRFAVAAAREVAFYAGERGVFVAVEPLNRYEAFLVNRIEQALAFIDDVDVPGLGIVVDLFHMNIEEVDPAAALELGLSRLLELHLADSNRRGLGEGHIPLEQVLSVASDFEGSFVVEVTAEDAAHLDEYLRQSAAVMRGVLSR